MAKSLSIAEARDRFAKVVHEAERGMPVSVTRRGKTVAVVVSAQEFERLRTARSSFWKALSAFRESELFDAVNAEPFDDVRDLQEGRSVDL